MLDFIDIGSSKGGSIRFCQRHFGMNGFGVDIDKRKVEKARKAGYDVRWQSIHDIKEKAKWVTCMHVIEHLSGREEAREMIKKMCEIGDNVLITFPSFDHDGYLYSWKLKTFWSDWVGHPYHCSSLELHNIIKGLGVNYRIQSWGEIEDSYSDKIIPLDVPTDNFNYKPEMGNKPNIHFAIPVFSEIRCAIGDTSILDRI